MNSCCLTELSEGHFKKELCYKPTSEITIIFSSAVYLGMLTLDQKSSRCSLIFCGLNLE